MSCWQYIQKICFAYDTILFRVSNVTKFFFVYFTVYLYLFFSIIFVFFFYSFLLLRKTRDWCIPYALPDLRQAGEQRTFTRAYGKN